MFEKYIEMSGVSLAIGAVLLVAFFFLVRFLFNKYYLKKDTEEEREDLTDTQVIGISVAVALVAAIGGMVAYKKYRVSMGQHDRLRESYYD